MSDDEWDDSSAFYKALPSDVDDGESLRLLTAVWETNDMWSGFEEEDLSQVVEVFSVLNMAPGDKLITKGEYATFCGIVLQGTFNAIVTPTFTVPLRAGDMVGEMALFEGGARNADIITGTDAEGCILAVITFIDLENLGANERYSALARKLTMMFATASIKKLRGMIKPAAPAATAAAAPAADSASGAAPSSPTPAAGGDASAPAAPAAAAAATPPAATAATPASAVSPSIGSMQSATKPSGESASAAAAAAKQKREQKKEEKKVVAETLYKNKLAARGSSGATNPDGTLAPKNLNEAQVVLEENVAKLKKAEHAKRNAAVMLEKLHRQLRAHEETEKQLEEQVARLTSELKAATENGKDLGAKLGLVSKALDESIANLESERQARRASETTLAQASAQLSAASQGERARMERDLAELTEVRAKLEQDLQAERETMASERETARVRENLHATQSAELQLSLERASKDASNWHAKSDELESELRSLSKLSDEQKGQIGSLSLRLADVEEKLASALSWKLKALEWQNLCDAEKKRHMRLSDEWSKTTRELDTELRQYKLLLRTFCVAIYVKEWRLRRAIGALHKRVSEMLLATLEEHYSTSTGKGGGVAAGASKGVPGGGSLSGSGSMGLGGGSSSAGMVVGGSHTAATFRSVRKRKKAYLDSLLRPSTKLRDVVASLDDEVSKLRGPFEELRERCVHWRATSEAFFRRNIDLASKLLSVDRSLAEAAQQRDSLASAAKASAKEVESLSRKHADLLSARMAGSAGSNTSSQNSAGDAKDSLSSASSASLASSSVADRKGLSAARSELESLEARATVLRVHVAQLESHYLALQQAIHSTGMGMGMGMGAAPMLPPSFVAAPYAQQQQGGVESKEQVAGSVQQQQQQQRFDLAHVAPVPFAPFFPSSAAAGYPSPPPSAPAGGGGAPFAHPSPRGAMLLSPRGGATGGVPIVYQQPGSSVYAPTAAAWSPRAPSAPQPPAGSGSASRGGGGGAGGDVLSLRALREQQNHRGATPNGNGGSNVSLPALLGASPSPHQPLLTLTPSTQRTALSFSPRAGGH